MTSTPMQQYRPWRFLVLLLTLVLLLVSQPMVRGFDVRGPVFDVRYSLVLVAAAGNFHVSSARSMAGRRVADRLPDRYTT